MRYTILSEGTCPLLNITTIGFAKSTRVTRYGPGRRNLYIIHYVLSGKGYFNGNTVSAGQGFLITPGLPEEYYPDQSDPWEFLWVISDDKKMADIFSYYHADQKTNIFNYSFVDTVNSVRDMLITNTNRVYNPFEILEIFLDMFKYHLKDSDSFIKKNNVDIYIDAALNYIKSNISNRITVTELTEIIGVSQPYLFRIFKDRFSKSPKQYIDDSKLTYAKKLLKETDMTVTQVAISVGFSDVLSFSKVFSTKTGVSPQNYRLK